MQKVAFTFGTGGTNVKASANAKGQDVQKGFDNIINLKSTSADNNVKPGTGGINTIAGKNSGANDKTAAQGKVNVINNGSSVNKDFNPSGNVADDFNALSYEVIDGELKVSLAEGTADNTPFIVDIDGLIEDIRKAIVDVLDITDEDIEEALAENGFVMLDLLNVTELQEFFVVIEDLNEFSDILINDSANQIWSQLFESVSDIKIEIFDDMFVTPQEFTEIINQLMNSEGTDGDETVNPDVMADAADSADEAVMTEVKTYVESDNGRQQAVENVAEQPADDEPVVIINDDRARANDNGGNGTDNGGQNNNMSDRQTEVSTGSEPKTEAADRTEAPVNESLFTQFMNRVEASFVQEVSYNTEQVQQLRDIANQVIESIKINFKPDTTGLEIQLNPEHLGRVNIAIEMRDGAAVANFIVRNEMARMALENQIQTLRETFEEQGLKVESVEVTVSDFSFEQSNNEWADRNGDQNSGGRRRFRNDEEIEPSAYAVNEAEDDPLAEEGSINIRA
jgi:flagellar hook-length control protein FliK